MRYASFPAMGTEVVLAVGEDADPRAAKDLFRTIELRCSRFLAESELSRINRDYRLVVGVSDEMSAVLRVAARLREATDGLVDVGVGTAVREWGYDRTFVEVSDTEAAPDPLESIGWTIEAGQLRRTPGVELDLGGLAKGWACDLTVERRLASVVSAGGDVRSSTPDALVEVLDPWDEVVATVPLGIGALATSSVTRRRWRAGSMDAHHIIDPRTLAPAVGPILSATVTATTAVEAEAGAKAVLLLGEHGLAWAERQEWLTGALVVWHDGSVFATTGLELAA